MNSYSLVAYVVTGGPCDLSSPLCDLSSLFLLIPFKRSGFLPKYQCGEAAVRLTTHKQRENRLGPRLTSKVRVRVFFLPKILITGRDRHDIFDRFSICSWALFMVPADVAASGNVVLSNDMMAVVVGAVRLSLDKQVANMAWSTIPPMPFARFSRKHAKFPTVEPFCTSPIPMLSDLLPVMFLLLRCSCLKGWSLHLRRWPFLKL